MIENRPCSVHPDLAVVGACDRCGDFGCRECLPNGKTCTKCAPGRIVAQPDVTRVLKWVFQDPRWISKVLIGAACFFFFWLLFVPLFILQGYGIRIARRERVAPQ